ncbi:MAG: 4Fe-4S binding protein [Provencibacterium sp.]|jgi:ferredoxin|nr:4Fe-4S binding protein [Provencibacterium sp.]
MPVYEIVFSPTGGTQKVSEAFTESFCSESIRVDLTDCTLDFSRFSFQEEDICIVSVPSYGGRVPATAVSRLQSMKGNRARAILVAVYGNRAYEDTLAELQDTLQNASFFPVAAVAAIAEHSILRPFAEGRPNAQDKKELAEFAVKIRSEIEAGKVSERLRVPGNRPYRAYRGVPMKPRTGKSCIRCGLCAEKCPVHAIPAGQPSHTNTAVCISCMRCISICPKKARKIPKLLLTAGSAKLKKACREAKKNECFL